MELTIEQKRAIALANARLRMEEEQSANNQPMQAPQQPEDLSMSAVTRGFVQNLVPSTVNAVGDMVQGVKQIVTDPVGTYKGYGDLVTGMAAKAGLPTARNVGEQNIPVADAVIDNYKQAYGGVDNIKRTLKTDPARALLDASTIATLGGSAMANVPGKVGQGAAMMRDASMIPGLPTAGRKTAEAVDSMVSRRNSILPAPSVDDLKAQAGKLYDQAEAAGVTAVRKDVAQLAGDMRTIAAQEGFISPTGRVNAAYPKVAEALRMMEDYATGNMDVPQMHAVRKTLANVARSSDGSEARMGTMMLRQFDEFTDPLAPSLREARGVYHKAMKGEMLDEAIELAKIRSSQYGASGMENALRTEFRGLARKIEKGQVTGFSPEEIAAIRKVAEGGPLENSLRTLGKLSPNSVVSLGVSGGMPFMIGNAVGGPMIGAGAAGGTMAAGMIGRNAATRMTLANANRASELARGGRTVVARQSTPVMDVANTLDRMSSSGIGLTPAGRKAIALTLWQMGQDYEKDRASRKEN